MRGAAVRTIWAVADLLEIVRGGLIMLASRTIGGES